MLYCGQYMSSCVVHHAKRVKARDSIQELKRIARLPQTVNKAVLFGWAAQTLP